MATVIRSFADVKAEIARAGLTQGAVARQMGMAPSMFSAITQDLTARPGEQFVARLWDAITALSGGVQST